MDGADPIPHGETSISAAAQHIRNLTPLVPRVALVLGTGLGGLAERITERIVIPYADVPHFPLATVAGHAGQLVFGQLGGSPVAAMQGRFHLYEGYTPQQIVLPLRTLHSLGADTLIVTNAAGGLDATYQAGDLMLIRDHIGLAMMSGINPLIGPNDASLGPRFPAMTDAYDVELRTWARMAANQLGIALREGVYVMLSGPTYETPAELRFLRLIGADAVGMSTVPEVIAARHMGMRVLAISCVTNVALRTDDTPVEPNHEEVVEAAERAGTALSEIITGVLERLH